MLQKSLLSLAVVFMLGSAVLGYLNKSKLDGIANEKAKVAADATSARADATKAKASLKETADKLTVETAKITEMQTQNAAKEGELAKATADVTNLTAQLTDKTAALDAANAEKEKLMAATPAVATTEVVPTDNSAQVAELTAQIEALKSEKAIIGDKLVAAESKTKELSEVVSNAKNAIMAKGVQGQVIAVNQAWGFVVLNLGDRSGIVNNAEMVVMRDGDRVGKLKITSVEPSNSIADIVPSSVASGQRILPGDQVIVAN